MMRLYIDRRYLKPNYTIGRFYINGAPFCDSLEDTVREDGILIPGKTAIQQGMYKVLLTFSNRFNRILPEIIDVPGRSAIRIHPGNTEQDTTGCILVGLNKLPGVLIESRKYSADLNIILQDQKDIWIKIVNNTANNPLYNAPF